MKKIVSVVANLLLSSTLFWGVPLAYGEELNSEEISTVPANLPSYCNMKSPAIRDDSLAWTHPVLEDSAVDAVDFYDRAIMIHSELTLRPSGI